MKDGFSRPKLVVIAAGGTGGHMFPAAAFSQAMQARGWRTMLMTDARGKRYADGFPAQSVVEVPAATISGANPVKMARAAWAIFAGVRAAQQRFGAERPRLVAGFGGYPSVPALAAARLGSIPLLIHEQNAVLGRVNRLFAGGAQAVASGFARLDRLPAKAMARHHLTGNPVRGSILEARATAYAPPSAGGALRVLITGGSQGAKLFGAVPPAAFAQLDAQTRARLQITHQVREEQIADVRAVYEAAGIAAELSPFFRDMGARLAQAHLVIARAGASTVSELAAAGRPAVLIPFAAAMDDHQTANAEGLAHAGACDVIAEADFTPERLASLLAERLTDPEGLARRAAAAARVGQPLAAEALADLAEKLAF